MTPPNHAEAQKLLEKRFGPEALKELVTVLRCDIAANCTAAEYLFECGSTDEAVNLATLSIGMAASNPLNMMTATKAISSLLHNCHYYGLSQNLTTELHRMWGEAATNIMPKMPQIQHRNGERIRIGYLVSNGNTVHPTNSFTNAAIKYHDRQKFETYIFDSTIRSKSNLFTTVLGWNYASKIKAGAEHYHSVAKLNDIALAELIQGLEIDVLVDAAGHMAFGRPLVLTMFGGVKIIAGAYPSTLGLVENAYLLGDRFHTPEEFSHLYTETVIRIESGISCFVPPDIPKITASPAEHNGYVTFSMFNNQKKTCDRYLGLVAGILQALPDSRLLVGAGEEWQMETLRGKLSAYGERVEYIPRCGRSKFIEQWKRVDINLDPVRYSGSATTLEAMLYGVPTVTLSGGERACQRHSYAFNRLTGHPELIAGNAAEYIHLACDLAGDRGQLKVYRQAMRRKALDSVGNGHAWMLEFEKVMEGLV